MKDTYNWFDDNWKLDVDFKTVSQELLLAFTYRVPMLVTEVRVYDWGALFPVCPRCGDAMEREYQHFCNCCCQRLDWSQYKINDGEDPPEDF